MHGSLDADGAHGVAGGIRSAVAIAAGLSAVDGVLESEDSRCAHRHSRVGRCLPVPRMVFIKDHVAGDVQLAGRRVVDAVGLAAVLVPYEHHGRRAV